MERFPQLQKKFDETIQHLKNELGGLRTGVAHASLVENILIDYYGVKTPLGQLASIVVQDAKTIVIQPWDKQASKEIEKSIAASSLGLHPINEGNLLRLVIPPLTEERRKELIKVLHEKGESARVSIRTAREEAWKQLKLDEQTGKISEDEQFRSQKDMQRIVDEYNEKIREIVEKKEKDIIAF